MSCWPSTRTWPGDDTEFLELLLDHGLGRGDGGAG